MLAAGRGVGWDGVGGCFICFLTIIALCHGHLCQRANIPFTCCVPVSVPLQPSQMHESFSLFFFLAVSIILFLLFCYNIVLFLVENQFISSIGVRFFLLVPLKENHVSLSCYSGALVCLMGVP